MSNRISDIKIAFDLELEQPKTNPQTPDSKIDSQKIIQVGWVIFNQKSGEILKENQAFVNIGVPLSLFIKRLTGITDSQIEQGSTLQEAAKKMIRDREAYNADRILYQWGTDTESLLSELGITRHNTDITFDNNKIAWPFGFSGMNIKHLYRIYAEARGLNPSGGLSKCIGRVGMTWNGCGKHNAVVDARNTALLAHRLFKNISF